MVIPKTSRPNPPRPPLKERPIVPPTTAPTEITFGAYPGNASLAPKLAALSTAILAIGGAIFFTTNPSAPAPKASTAVVEQKLEVGQRLLVGFGGWIEDFVPTGGDARRPHVSLLRGSEKLTNFRLEFSGQIQSNALGWIFRAKDPRNYYVMKLEVGEPSGILTRFAVINGIAQPRVQIPLPITLKTGAVYQVRQDVLGNTFTTSIQGQKVDQWVDRQIPIGGVGLYGDPGERGDLKGPMAVFTLRSAK